MEDNVQEVLQQCYIHPSTSPACAGFFFSGGQRGGLHPCFDCRGLSQIMVKYLHSLPLVPSALEQFHSAKVFTKFDLHSAYNLVLIREGNEGMSFTSLLATLTTVSCYMGPFLVVTAFLQSVLSI